MEKGKESHIAAKHKHSSTILQNRKLQFRAGRQSATMTSSRNFAIKYARCVNTTLMPNDFAMSRRSYRCDCTVESRGTANFFS